MNRHNEYTAAFMFFYGLICLYQGQTTMAAYWLVLTVVVWAFNVRLVGGRLRADRLNLPARVAVLRQWLA